MNGENAGMDRTVLERKLHKKGRTPDMDGRLTLWDYNAPQNLDSVLR